MSRVSVRARAKFKVIPTYIRPGVSAIAKVKHKHSLIIRMLSSKRQTNRITRNIRMRDNVTDMLRVNVASLLRLRRTNFWKLKSRRFRKVRKLRKLLTKYALRLANAKQRVVRCTKRRALHFQYKKSILTKRLARISKRISPNFFFFRPRRIRRIVHNTLRFLPTTQSSNAVYRQRLNLNVLYASGKIFFLRNLLRHSINVLCKNSTSSKLLATRRSKVNAYNS